MPYFALIPDAYAFNLTSGEQSNIKGIAGYIHYLAPKIVRLPGCRDIIGVGNGAIFAKIKNSALGKKITKKLNDKIKTTASSALSKAAGKLGVGSKSIKVSLIETDRQLLSDTADNTGDTAKETKKMSSKQLCLDGIGKLIAKLLLKNMTISMVNWINTGYEGKPSFVQNPGKFLEKIGQQEILKFGNVVADVKLFPYGKDFMRNQAIAALQNTFSTRAQSNLARLMAEDSGYTPAQFKLDFRNGGWGAWTALTQSPGNNAFSFNLIASEEIAKKTKGTTEEYTAPGVQARISISDAQGFLNMDRCKKEWMQEEDTMNGGTKLTDPARYETNHKITRAEEAKFQAEGTPHTGNYGHCAEWETVTPGMMVSNAAKKTGEWAADNIWDAKDLNDSLMVILDAVVTKFTSDLQRKQGYAGLIDGAGSSSSDDSNNEGDSLTSYDQTDKDFSTDEIEGTFLADNPTFNVRTDITQAMIDDQRTFVQKLKDQNRELFSTIPTNGIPYFTGNYGLIPIVHQLDFCIPGPHPGWEDGADTKLENLKDDNIVDVGGMNFMEIGTLLGGQEAESMKGLLDASIAGSMADLSGTLTPVNFDLIYSLGNGGVTLSQEEARKYYHQKIQNMLGLNAHKDMAIETYDDTINIIDTAFQGFLQVVHNVFNPLVMPSSLREANTEFEALDSYNKLYENNKTNIATKNNTIVRLIGVKNAIATINADPNTPPGSAASEAALKPWISAFARLAPDLMTGNDIAKADGIVKDIIDKEKYIYNELLKGSVGCEQELSKPATALDPNKLPQLVLNGIRFPYPLPVLYDYNSIGHLAPLPDPLGSILYDGVGSYTPYTNTQAYWNKLNPYPNHYNEPYNSMNAIIPYNHYWTELSWAAFNGFPGGPGVNELCGYVLAYPDTHLQPTPCDGSSGPTIIHISGVLNADYANASGVTLDVLEHQLGLY